MRRLPRRAGALPALVISVLIGTTALTSTTVAGAAGDSTTTSTTSKPSTPAKHRPHATTTTSTKPKAKGDGSGHDTTTSSSSTTTTSAPKNSPKAGVLTTAQKSRFARAATQLLAEYEIPGAVVGVFTPDSEWVLTRGYANVNAKRKVERSDRFAIRSVTKSFVVTALLQLVDRGDVTLDDPVSRYVDGVPNGDQITLRELAAMTSGLADYTSSPTFRAAFGADLSKKYTDRQLADFGLALPPLFAPDAQYDYSNTNTVLLGLVIEKVTGKSLGDVLKRRIFEPLHLKATSYDPAAPMPDPHALGYDVDPDTGETTRLDASRTSLGPSGAMVSDLDDMRVWAEALATGKLIHKSSQWERLGAARLATDGPVYDRYGLGIGETNGWWGHTGQGVGYQAAVFHDPQSGATIVALVNSAPPVNVPDAIFEALARELRQA
jgi:D-alanyl-D-alanine carboxypeptidase